MTSEEYTTFRGDRRPMFNRLDFSSWGEDPPEENFFVIRGECGLFYVARDTAVAVAETLEQDEPPRWIRFTDLQGSEVRVRSALIDCIVESTARQRDAERRFLRARQREDAEDQRPWEEE